MQNYRGVIVSLEEKVEGLASELRESEEKRQNLRKHNGELNVTIVALEEETYESKKIQHDLIEKLKDMVAQLKVIENQLKAKESELEMKDRELQAIVKQEKLYIPKKECKIDKRLAEYLNKRQDQS